MALCRIRSFVHGFHPWSCVVCSLTSPPFLPFLTMMYWICTLPMAGGWSLMILCVPSMILWFLWVYEDLARQTALLLILVKESLGYKLLSLVVVSMYMLLDSGVELVTRKTCAMFCVFRHLRFSLNIEETWHLHCTVICFLPYSLPTTLLPAWKNMEAFIFPS